MKKLIAIVLVLAMCLPLCACGTNLEKLCDGYKLTRVFNSETLKYYAKFKDGTLTIEKYVPNSSSYGGKWKVAETQEYSYELQGNDTVIINGLLTYTYEISGTSVTFSDDLLGITKYWKRP